MANTPHDTRDDRGVALRPFSDLDAEQGCSLGSISSRPVLSRTTGRKQVSRETFRWGWGGGVQDRFWSTRASCAAIVGRSGGTACGGAAPTGVRAVGDSPFPPAASWSSCGAPMGSVGGTPCATGFDRTGVTGDTSLLEGRGGGGRRTAMGDGKRGMASVAGWGHRTGGEKVEDACSASRSRTASDTRGRAARRTEGERSGSKEGRSERGVAQEKVSSGASGMGVRSIVRGTGKEAAAEVRGTGEASSKARERGHGRGILSWWGCGGVPVSGVEAVSLRSGLVFRFLFSPSSCATVAMTGVPSMGGEEEKEEERSRGEGGGGAEGGSDGREAAPTVAPPQVGLDGRGGEKGGSAASVHGSGKSGTPLRFLPSADGGGASGGVTEEEDREKDVERGGGANERAARPSFFFFPFPVPFFSGRSTRSCGGTHIQ